MYNFRTEDEIKRDMLRDVKNTVDKSENSIIHDALGPAAIEFQNTYVELDYVSGKIDPENLEAVELEKYTMQNSNTTRKLATVASGIVEISGNEGSMVRAGDLVSTGDMTFVVTESKQIGESLVVEVMVECEEEGSIGNVPAHTIVEFPTSISGLNSVTNPMEVTNGYDDETDRELLDRHYEKIRKPITSGNKYHYLQWAKEVKGVGGARIISLWAGDNTVKVIIIDSNKQDASEELIEQVQEHIDPNSSGLGEGEAPIGAFCTVVSATKKPINISVEVNTGSGYSLEQVKESIEEEVTGYLKQIAFNKNLVSHAQIGSLILSVEGIQDYTNFTINEDIENISITDEEVAVLGEVIVDEQTP